MNINEIVYEKNGNKVKLAGLDNGKLTTLEMVDLSKALSGNIYLGRITKKIELANGKSGYFVNLGKDRDAFMNADENGRDDINANEGQEVIVQVAQEQRAEKGAKLVRSLQFVGRNLVYCPYKMGVEVSSRIKNKDRNDELYNLVMENVTGQEGWIVRTSAETADNDNVIEEMDILRNNFNEVRIKAQNSKAPELLYERNDLLMEVISHYGNYLKKIVVNNHNIEKALADDFNVEYSAEPFKEYGFDEKIIEAMQKEIRLNCGGRINIEETKACVAIDVDSGDDNGAGNLGHLNMEAAEEIVHQIRLRNLSGKIIIDFAGSSEYKFLKNVIAFMEQELSQDYIRTNVLGLSRGGLVEILRMRRRPTLIDIFSEECPTCKGVGRVEK